MLNWVDFVIILIFCLYVWDGYRRGFFKLAWELLGIIVAFFFAVKFYPFFSNILSVMGVSVLYSKPTSFLSVWFITQGLFYIIGRVITFYWPWLLKECKANSYLGLIPASLKGFVFISVLLVLFLIIPFGQGIKNTISGSLIGGWMVRELAKIEYQISKAFSSDGLITFTSPMTADQQLDFKTTEMEIDEEAEGEMLDAVNIERQKQGLPALKANILVRNVARAHSRDMLLRGYFSHVSADGKDLGFRLNSAKVEFGGAAENIALAPTIDLAEIGLMNSPKHRENILNPEFTSVGIGIVDAGTYGLMVTQNFIK